VALLTITYLLVQLAVYAIANVKFWFMLGDDRNNYALAGMSSTVQSIFPVLLVFVMFLIVPSMGRSKTVIWGLVISMTGALIYAFVPPPLLRTVMLLPMFGGIATAIVMSLITEKVGMQRHAATIGGVTSLGFVTTLLAVHNSTLFRFIETKAPEYLFITTIIPGVIFLMGLLVFTNIRAEERA